MPVRIQKTTSGWINPSNAPQRGVSYLLPATLGDRKVEVTLVKYTDLSNEESFRFYGSHLPHSIEGSNFELTEILPNSPPLDIPESQKLSVHSYSLSTKREFYFRKDSRGVETALERIPRRGMSKDLQYRLLDILNGIITGKGIFDIAEISGVSENQVRLVQARYNEIQARQEQKCLLI